MRESMSHGYVPKGDVPYRYRYDTGTGTSMRLSTASGKKNPRRSTFAVLRLSPAFSSGDGSVFGSGDSSGFGSGDDNLDGSGDDNSDGSGSSSLYGLFRICLSVAFLCHLLPAVTPSTESSPAVTLSLFVSLSLVGRGLNPRRLEASVRSSSSVHTTAVEKDNPQQPLWSYVKKI
ncbi:hypothetical protein EJ110_NYTH47203 [Nymphaea thermarum]|nr:hypothetical protein EJ110_NYTH47203 [Nymphaea thermarum]